MNTLSTVSKLQIVFPLRNNGQDYLGGMVEVAGEAFRIKGDLAKTWLNIIDADGRQESCVIEDGYIVHESGEWVTEHWTDEDWKAMNLHLAQAKA